MLLFFIRFFVLFITEQLYVCTPSIGRMLLSKVGFSFDRIEASAVLIFCVSVRRSDTVEVVIIHVTSEIRLISGTAGIRSTTKTRV